MRVLMALTCLLAVSASVSPGAKEGTLLNKFQTDMAYHYNQYLPGGQLSLEYSMALMTARFDLCKISGDAAAQLLPSIILGQTCKDAFVELNKEEDQCSDVFCDVASGVVDFLNDAVVPLIEAEYDKDFFQILEEKVLDPTMAYSCKCLVRLLDASIGCKDTIGEAAVWFTLQMIGFFDTQAEYLGGRDWKEFWVDLITNRIPWEDIEIVVNRTLPTFCQRNSDEQGKAKCYSYFYNTFTTLYQWFLKSVDLGLDAVSKKEKKKMNDDLHCTTFDFLVFDFSGFDFSENIIDYITIGDIKEALVDKFCVPDCKDLYQEILLGCCTASFTQDHQLVEAYTNAVINTAETMEDIITDINPRYRAEEDNKWTYTLNLLGFIADYFEDTVDMFRYPTCVDTGVSYEATPCEIEEDSEEDPCEGLEGKKRKYCKRKAKKEKKKGGKGGEKGGKKGEEGGVEAYVWSLFDW